MREALERSIAGNTRRQEKLDSLRPRGKATAGSVLSGILSIPEQSQLRAEREGFEPQIQEFARQDAASLSNAIRASGASPEQIAAFSTLPVADQQKIFTSQFNREPKERRIIKDAQGINRDVATGRPIFEGMKPKAEDRKTAIDQQGVLRYLDNKKVVFPEVTGDAKLQLEKQKFQEAFPEMEAKLLSTSSQIDALFSHPGFTGAVGSGFQKSIPFTDAGDISKVGGGFAHGSDAADFSERLKQLKGGAFLQARQFLKGQGAISDTESTKAENAQTRMSLAQGEEEFKIAALEYKKVIDSGLERLRKKAGRTSKKLQQTPIPASEYFK